VVKVDKVFFRKEFLHLIKIIYKKTHTSKKLNTGLGMVVHSIIPATQEAVRPYLKSKLTQNGLDVSPKPLVQTPVPPKKN
jgi:hypothetical protein